MSGKLRSSESLKRTAFLAAFAQTGNITAAAKAAGCSASTHYEVWIKQKDYPPLFEQAQREARDLLEAEALRRATRGTDEPVWHKGKQCGTVRKYSDTLLIFLLKGAWPEKYRETIDHDHSGRVVIETYNRKRHSEAA